MPESRLKKIAVRLFFGIVLAAITAGFCRVKFYFDHEACDRWDHFPITVGVNNEVEAQVLQRMNKVFGAEFFADDKLFGEINFSYVDSLNGRFMWPWEKLTLGRAEKVCDGGLIVGANVALLKTYEGDKRGFNILAHELLHSIGISHMKKGLMLPSPELLPFLPFESFITKDLQREVLKKINQPERGMYED